jgi:hypothetical protein
LKNEKTSIQTYSGILLDLENPAVEDILLPDIAHQLSNICRFTGACRKFYSVAQHCSLVSKLIQEDGPLKLVGLLHDASEAYLSDVVSPLKALLPDYHVLEDRMEKTIILRFGLNIPNFEEVKFYDRLALDIESKALMGPRYPNYWPKSSSIMEDKDYDLDWELLTVNPLSPEEAEKEYLDIFNKLWLNRL